MSEKKKILILQKIHIDGIQLLENNPNFEYEIIEDTNVEILKSKIKDCDGLSLRTTKLPAEIMNLGKKLKIISRHGVGYDNVDLEVSKKNNITIAITATANAVAVAEHVFFMLLSLCKRKSLLDETVRSGRFKDKNKLPGTMELWKKKYTYCRFWQDR